MSKSNAGRIGVWGASGSGKSSYVKQRIKGLKRLVVFDPMDEYGALCKVRATSPEQVRIAMRDDWHGFTVRYVPQAGNEPRELSSLCRLLIVAQQPFKDGTSRQGIMLVVEEMNTSFPVHGGSAKCPGFANVCSRGRHFGISVFGLSQRIAEVDTRFRGNTDETVVLRQKGPRDLDAAANELGLTKADVSTLQNLEYIHEKQGVTKKGQISFK